MGICVEEDLKCNEGETARKKQTRDRDEKSNRVRLERELKWEKRKKRRVTERYRC